MTMRTTAPRCPTCGGQSRDWSLCRACANTLLSELRALPDVMRDLQDKRVGRTVMPAPANMVSDPEEAPVPFSDQARRVHDLIVSTVGSWIRALTQDAADLDDLGPTMPSWCSWLAQRIDRIRYHEAAGQIADDIGGCIKRARAAVDLPPELRLVQRCEVCGHGIFAGPEDKTVVCVHCKRANVEPLPEIDVEQARSRLDGMVEHQWATASKCALVLAAYGMPVRADTIQNWARPERGGRLKVRGVDGAGRRLYRVGDVADLVRAATRRVTSDAASSLDRVTESSR